LENCTDFAATLLRNREPLRASICRIFAATQQPQSAKLLNCASNLVMAQVQSDRCCRLIITAIGALGQMTEYLGAVGRQAIQQSLYFGQKLGKVFQRVGIFR
jgi:hypothetical protein